MYLGAGLIHAYLRGFGIELMSNSDNVVRGGLSVRHVDIPEFIKTLQYNESPVEPTNPREVEKSTDVPACEIEGEGMLFKAAVP